MNQAEAGGDRAEGQAAWDSVRSAFTHEKVVKGKGGLDTLGARMDAIEGQPAFHSLFYGDASGKAVWSNLRTIQTGYEHALAQGEAGIAAAKAAGKGGTEALGELAAQRTAAARETGQAAVQRVREAGAQTRAGVSAAGAQTRAGVAEAGKRAVETEQATSAWARRMGQATAEGYAKEFGALKTSSLGRALRPNAAMEAAADALRVVAHGPTSAWGALPLFRLMRGPTATDLVHWAALTPGRSQALVKAMTGPKPGYAVAALLRTSGILGDEEEGMPPPAPEEAVGAPPPGPPAPSGRQPADVYLSLKGRSSAGAPPPR